MRKSSPRGAQAATETASDGAAPSADTQTAARDRGVSCPVDLSAPFSDEVVQRARTLGLAVARTEPLPQNPFHSSTT